MMPRKENDMEYIKRSLESRFLSMNSVFKCILLVGARQVGKSTMLKHLAEKQKRTYVSMDDGKIRDLAQREPDLFFQMYRPPLLIDEVQKAPALFEKIKIICDNTEEKGLFWMTGSQSRKLMREAGDSLAGRMGILKMYSLSEMELMGFPNTKPLEFSFPKLQKRAENIPVANVTEVFKRIWTGGMPEVLSLNEQQIQDYWNSYIESYLMRDAVDDNGISDTTGFRKFLRACAAFSGQLLNYNDLAQAADVSGVTAKDWVRVLESMGIIYLLEPYYTNELKRLTKTPKLYFCDTGLCAYLSSWTNWETMMNGASSGHYFENHAVNQFLRSYTCFSAGANLNFYRDVRQREIDLIIEENGVLHPVEIKKTARPDPTAAAAFSVLDKSEKKVGGGGVICMMERPFPLDAVNSFIPINII